MKLKQLALSALAATMLMAAPSASAGGKDDLQTFSIQEFMSNSAYMEKLEGVRFSFGSTPGNKIKTLTSRKMTKKIGRSAQEACEWALLSALLSFKDAATSHGASSVQGLQSVATEAGPFVSSSEYQCRVGKMMVRVYLSGSLVN